jgi:hypothetical protein
MTKYRTTMYKAEDGTSFVFVTRGKSEPFTNQEIQDFLARNRITRPIEAVDERLKQLMDDKPTVIEEPTNTWRLSNGLGKVFLADLKCGLEFCKSKYAVTDADIISEANRLFPSLNLEKLWETNGRKR